MDYRRDKRRIGGSNMVPPFSVLRAVIHDCRLACAERHCDRQPKFLRSGCTTHRDLRRVLLLRSGHGRSRRIRAITARNGLAESAESANSSGAYHQQRTNCMWIEPPMRMEVGRSVSFGLATPRAKILLVEDNELNRDMLSRRLERRGFKVALACDGRQAIFAAKTESPDLILMDLSLPEIDGWEATRLLKSTPAFAEIPILVLSAHA